MSGKSDKDPMGDRIKQMESQGVQAFQFNDDLPLYIRLDGRSFSKLTKGLKAAKPFDPRITSMMVNIADYLVRHFSADLAYVQSDEITIVWKQKPVSPGQVSRFMFSGRPVKLLTTMAASAASIATMEIYKSFGEHRIVSFDARAAQPKDDGELANAVLWRMFDCRRNAVQAIAQSIFSHKQLQGIDFNQQKAMIREHLGSNLQWPWSRQSLLGTTLVHTPEGIEHIIQEEHEFKWSDVFNLVKRADQQMEAVDV